VPKLTQPITLGMITLLFKGLLKSAEPCTILQLRKLFLHMCWVELCCTARFISNITRRHRRHHRCMFIQAIVHDLCSRQSTSSRSGSVLQVPPLFSTCDLRCLNKALGPFTQSTVKASYIGRDCIEQLPIQPLM
jgi:hypothetical protein